MTIPTKKLKNGFEMPVFGLGTWLLGGTTIHNPDNDDAKDIQTIKNAINNGVTHIDTAELYADGYAETLVGHAIKDYNRTNLFLTSKVWETHLGYDDLINAAKASLARLQTNYLDLYLTHRFSTAIKDTMRAMDKLVEDGLVKYIGVSNYTVVQMQEAQSYTKNKLVTNQLHYNLKIREVEKKGILKYCQENDVLLTAWRPLQKGMVLNAPILMEMAEKYHKTSAQIALNWLIAQDNVVVISKAANPEHLKDSLGAIGWVMDKDDIEKLRNEFPDQQALSDAVPLS